MKKIVILGPGHPLRGGGLTTFNHRLARAFIDEGYQCEIWSFSLQYPAILFPGKSQYTDEPAPGGITIRSVINSINPFNWLRVGNMLKKEKPDLVVVRFWLPFMAPALGTILRRVIQNGHTRIVCIADNIIPHEKRPGDKLLTKYFLKPCHAFITMSRQVMNDLRLFDTEKPAKLVPHPLYDNFGTGVSKSIACEKLNLSPDNRFILFFGFIRKYKGLDLLLEAMNRPDVKALNVKLLVAGEFYENEQPYLDIINNNALQTSVILHNRFIPDDEVKYYFSVADVVVQPYRHATQSGVTPLAYHFEKPMIVTRVGGLPDMVPHMQAGIVCEPDADSIAAAIEQFYQLGEQALIPHLRVEKQKYSWSALVSSIIKLADRSGR